MSSQEIPPSPNSLNLSNRETRLSCRRTKLLKKTTSFGNCEEYLNLSSSNNMNQSNPAQTESQVNRIFHEADDIESETEENEEAAPAVIQVTKVSVVDTQFGVIDTQFLNKIRLAESKRSREESTPVHDKDGIKKAKLDLSSFFDIFPDKPSEQLKGKELLYEESESSTDSISDVSFAESERTEEELDIMDTTYNEIDISSKAMENIHQLSADFETQRLLEKVTQTTEKQPDDDVGSCERTGDTCSSDPHDRLKRVKNHVFGDDIPEGDFPSFQTAHGKPLPVEEAIHNVDSHVFNDSDFDEEAMKYLPSQQPPNPPTNEVPEFLGFQWLNGERVEPTEEDLRKTREILEEIKREAAANLRMYEMERREEEETATFLKSLENDTKCSQPMKRPTKFCTEQARILSQFRFGKEPAPTVSQEVAGAKAALLLDSDFVKYKIENPQNDWLQRKINSKWPVGLQFRTNLQKKKITPEMAAKRECLVRAMEDGISRKSEEHKRPFLSDFIQKKLSKNKSGLRDIVGGTRPASQNTPIIREHIICEPLSDFSFKLLDYFGDTDSALIRNAFQDGLKFEHYTVPMNQEFVVGFNEISLAFRNARGIDPSLISDKWIRNAYEMALWKLASLEIAFPDVFQETFTITNVLNTLHYRYYQEIDQSCRSVIKKFLEKDELPSHLMVLFVAGIENDQIILSDGWYKITTVVDAVLEKQITNYKIRQGTKLIIAGAELLNSEKGFSPLEVPEFVMLKISGNGTRRCRWDTKLGRYFSRRLLRVPLESVKPNGGVVSSVQVRIFKIYPMVFISEDFTGKPVHRSQRMQDKYRQEIKSRRFDLFQKSCEEVKKEMEKEELEEIRSSSKLDLSPRKIDNIDDPEELHRILQKSYDPERMEKSLSSDQKQDLAVFREGLNAKRIVEFQYRIEQKNKSLANNEDALPLLKIRVETLTAGVSSYAVLSIRNPNDECLERLTEGRCYQFNNLLATGTRYKTLQLSSGMHFCFKELPQHAAVESRCISQIKDMPSNFDPAFGEFDTVGLVYKIGKSIKNKFQHVLLIDESLTMMCVYFWSGIGAYALEDVVKVNQVIALSNLEIRKSSTAYSLPNGCVTETTIVTSNPRNQAMYSALENLTRFKTNYPVEDIATRLNEKYGFLSSFEEEPTTIVKGSVPAIKQKAFPMTVSKTLRSAAKNSYIELNVPSPVTNVASNVEIENDPVLTTPPEPTKKRDKNAKKSKEDPKFVRRSTRVRTQTTPK